MFFCECARILGLRFPVILRQIAVPVLDNAAFGQERFAVLTGVEIVFTHKIGVFLSHFFGPGVVHLQAELRVKPQSLDRFVIQVEDRLYRAGLERVVRAGTLFEVVEIQDRLLVAEVVGHIGIVEIAAVGVVGRQVGIDRAGVARRTGKRIGVGDVGGVFVLSHEHRSAETQVFQQVVVGLQREVQTLESRTFGRSLFVVITAREVVAGLVAAAREADAVLLVQGHAVNLLAPVGAVLPEGVDRRLRFGGERREIPAVDKRRTLTGFVQDAGHAAHVLHEIERSVRGQSQFKIDFLRSVHQIEFLQVGTVGYEERCRDVDARGLVAGTLPGGDDDDAVGRAGAVDGRCGGIFQHGDVLDVGGVETRNRHVVEVVDVVFRRPVRGYVVAFERHAVQYPQRVGVAVQGHRTADLDFAGGARGARCGSRGESCDRTREHLVDARHAVACDVRHLDVGDRRRELALLDALVSGHHNGVHLAFRCREVDREIAFTRNVEGLRLVAEVADHDFLDAHGQFEGEAPLFVSDGSLRVVILGLGLFGRNEDGGAHQRRTVGTVEDLPGDLPCLLRQREQGADQNE